MTEVKKLKLSAIDTYQVTNIVSPEETEIRGKEYIGWGDGNKYPEYLLDLYGNVVTLQSIINGTSDFICGNDVICNVEKFKDKVNSNGDTMLDVLRKLSVDKLIFGGCALQVIRNLGGDIAELIPLDFSKVRSNEKNDVFYYSKDWGKWGCKAIAYPKYGLDDENPTSIYYDKGHLTRGVYPVPMYAAATIPCEIEKSINEFHLNNINNGFTANLIICFNNGIPSDDEQEEIENKISEKFSGKENAGRFLVAYADTKDNAVTIERLDSDDFDDKYEALAERSRTQIFSSFRAPSVLFGINPDQTGFNEIEFNEAFKLYNRTVVRPLQAEFVDMFDKIFGVKGSITIEPFTLTPKGNDDDAKVVE